MLRSGTLARSHSIGVRRITQLDDIWLFDTVYVYATVPNVPLIILT